MRTALNLQEILYRLVRSGAQDAIGRASSGDASPGRFPVSVKPATRTFLEAEAEALNTSIGGLAGAILDSVAQNTTGVDSGAYALRGIADRVLLLLGEHGLSVPAGAEVLTPYGIGLAELRSTEKLEVALSGHRLRELADLFSVSYEWLVGKSERPGYTHPHVWYKNSAVGALRAIRQAADGWDVELSLLRREGDDFEKASREDHASGAEFIPVMTCTKSLVCGEELTCHQVWELGYWSYWKARAFAKILVHLLYARPAANASSSHRVRISGRTIGREDFEALKTERAIPASIVGRARRVDWHPEDYVIVGSPVSKDTGEWQSILEGREIGVESRSFEAGLEELAERK